MKTKLGVDRNNYHEVEKWWEEHQFEVIDALSKAVGNNYPEGRTDWTKGLTEVEATSLILDLMFSFDMDGQVITKTKNIVVGDGVTAWHTL
jgi:hypothetical protein